MKALKLNVPRLEPGMKHVSIFTSGRLHSQNCTVQDMVAVKLLEFFFHRPTRAIFLIIKLSVQLYSDRYTY